MTHARRQTCAYCDCGFKFGVKYTTESLPGKMFCSCACMHRYGQQKQQHDRALKLQPVHEEGGRCECHLCMSDP